MSKWNHSLPLVDIFHDETMAFVDKRSAIVERIRESSFYTGEDLDWELDEIVMALDEAEDEDDFNMVWDEFYDWCDAHRVWVATL